MKRCGFVLLGCLLFHSAQAEIPLPVIDMHLHALKFDAQGPPPLGVCTPFPAMPRWDQRQPYADRWFDTYKNPPCDDPVWSAMSDEELIQRSLADMVAHNVYGVLSGPADRLDAWMAAAPERFLRGHYFSITPDAPSPDELVALHEEGRLEVLAEITTQYQGIKPAGEELAPYWAMLEENDIPAGIHIGPGPPGVIYLGASGYRAHLHSALTLEEVLAKHPQLRVYIMHAGFPMLDDLLAVMFSHPQVYVEVGVIVWTQPKAAFYRYLQGVVDAGFGDRVMFGSDQMVWPETIGRSIQIINDAPFLSEEQKRDILFNNAARFLRLSDNEIARMYAGK